MNYSTQLRKYSIEIPGEMTTKCGKIYIYRKKCIGHSSLRVSLLGMAGVTL